MKTTVVQNLTALRSLLQRSVPYLLLEILLPGGTLFALLLFVFERRHKLAVARPQRLHVIAAHAIGKLRKEFVVVVQPNGIATSVWRRRDGARDGVEVLAMARAA
ncbi:MAG TPA: hypothetical protein VGA51_15650 [Casimicrobiaceae bacterium]